MLNLLVEVGYYIALIAILIYIINTLEYLAKNSMYEWENRMQDREEDF